MTRPLGVSPPFISAALRKLIAHAFAEQVIAAGHAQRVKHVFNHVRFELLTADILDELSQRGIGVVGIRPLQTGVNLGA
jgi:hypothetical protein